MLWLGWKTRYEPRSHGFHIRFVTPERRAKLPAEINSWSVRNRFLMQLNNLSLRAHARSLHLILLRNLLVVFGVLLSERTSAGALKEAWRLAPRALKRRRELFSRARESRAGIARWFARKPYAEPALACIPVSGGAIRRLAAVVVSYGTGTLALECVRTLLESRRSVPFPLSITLVDNSPEHHAGAVRLPVPEGVVFLRRPENLGFAGAVNAALNDGEHDALLVLNPDIRIGAADLMKLVSALESYGEIGAVAPVLLGADGKPQHGFTARRFPTLGATVCELFFLHRLVPRNPWTERYRLADDPWTAAYLERREDAGGGPREALERPLIVDQPAGAALLLRTATARDLGGLDTRFHPAWFEDVDFCKRLRQAGRVAAIVGDAKAEHSGGVTKEVLGTEMFARYWYANLLRYWRKHGSFAERCLLRVLVPAALFLRAVMYSLIAPARLTKGTASAGAELRKAKSFFRLSVELMFS
jgi:GT2 family glycosyltransferase